MTRTVTTVQGRTVERTVEIAERAEGDIVEVRLDALEDPTPDDVERLICSVDADVMATLRSEAEGGRYPGDRDPLLQAAIDAEPAWIDLERRDQDHLDEARSRGIRVVVSRHLDDPVNSGTILADLEKSLALGADVAKVAMPVEGTDDVGHLLEAATTACRRGLAYTAMGLGDSVLRALAPTLGMTLVYAAPRSGAEAAPGQLPVDLIARLHRTQARKDPVKLAGLIGGDVRRSLSPPMHNAAFDAVEVPATYVPLNVPPDELGRAVETLTLYPFLGVNVTIPHKETIVPHLDRVETSAERAGAVNTVRVEGGRLIGHNTDVHGIRKALARVEVPDGPALILGAGGAARAAVVALASDRPVRVANRTPERAEELAREFDVEPFSLDRDDVETASRDASVVLNATPVAPDVPWGLVQDDAVALDLVYRPRGTELLARAAREGLTTVSGDRVLLHQAAMAFELWTRHDAPVPIMDAALEEAYGR